MSGCVVVKPRVDIFKLHPPIFKHNATAISVREDFSDLEEQIMPYLTDIPRAQVRPVLRAALRCAALCSVMCGVTCVGAAWVK